MYICPIPYTFIYMSTLIHICIYKYVHKHIDIIHVDISFFLIIIWIATRYIERKRTLRLHQWQQAATKKKKKKNIYLNIILTQWQVMENPLCHTTTNRRVIEVDSTYNDRRLALFIFISYFIYYYFFESFFLINR